MNTTLSFRRLGRLFLKDFAEDTRSVLITVGAVTGVLLLNYLIAAATGGTQGLESEGAALGTSVNAPAHLVYFTMGLLIGGFIISSRAFSELHAKSRNHDWLMLPASHFEKYLSRLLLTGAAFALGTVLYFFLFSLLALGLTKLLFGIGLPIFNPFDGAVWMLVLHYLVLQSLFFAGAVYFKKAHFIKTVLVLTAFAIVLALIAAGVARLAFWREFHALTSGQVFSHLDLSVVEPRLARAGHTISVIARVAYWALLAPLMWFFAYTRLAEAEVRNGV